jgi:hypothetical protein
MRTFFWKNICLLVFSLLLAGACANRPAWIFQPPLNTVVGTSGEFATEQEARNDAMKDAALQVARHYGVYISGSERDTGTIDNKSGDTERYKTDSSSYTQQLVSQLTPMAYYPVLRRGRHQVYVLCEIPPRELAAQQAPSAQVHAALEFNESSLIEEDKLILRNGLLEALRDYHVPVQLDTRPESGAYLFIISIVIRKPAYEVDKDLREYYVALAFEGNGASVTPVSETFSELSFDIAIRKAALFIKTSERFFQELRSGL